MYLQTFEADSNSIPLPTGRNMDMSEVQFNATTQRAMVGMLDVTPYMTFAQLSTFPGFDGNKFLDNKYVQGYQQTHGGASPPPVGSTSTLYNFIGNLEKETLGGPGTQIQKIYQAALMLGGIWLAIQLVGAYRKGK